MPGKDLRRRPDEFRALLDEVMKTPGATGRGLVPVVMWANTPDEVNEYWPGLMAAVRDISPRLVHVPAWEPTWTAPELAHGIARIQSLLGPDAPIFFHGGPREAAGPVSGGGAPDFWTQGAGRELAGFLYQTEHGRTVTEPCGPRADGSFAADCWLNRWQDVVARLGAGRLSNDKGQDRGPGWRRVKLVLFETVAYRLLPGARRRDNRAPRRRRGRRHLPSVGRGLRVRERSAGADALARRSRPRDSGRPGRIRRRRAGLMRECPAAPMPSPVLRRARVCAWFVLWAFGLPPVLAGGPAAPLREPAQTSPLNVLLLVIDDTRWDALGAAGNATIRTPRLDRLAAEGIRFRQAFVTTSICMVSRASILSGQYMSRHGITRFGQALPESAWAATYPGVLRDAGYWTGFVGKYGVGAARPKDFDFLRAYEGQHWMTDASGEALHVTEKNARDALDFLRTRPADRPFALSVSFFAAHAVDASPDQYLPQPSSADAYRGVTMPPPIHGDDRYRTALPPFLQQPSNEGRVRFGWRFDTPERYQDYLTRYYRLVTEVDAAVGRLLDELTAQDVARNTVVIFIGDNGYFQGDRGLADKWYPYEESIRVPLLVRDPRLPAARRGQVVDAMTLNIDVAPTIVGAAGRPVPTVMQGRDLSPLYLGDRPPAWRDEFFYEHPTITSKDRIPSSLAVVRRDWKYVRWPEFDHEQLFDLVRDPDELRSLVGSPEHAGLLATARARLAEWMARAR